MRYVGNMRRNTPANSRKQTEKAVFPPGSIVPESLADNAVVFGENRSENQQENMRNNSGQTNVNSSNNMRESTDFQENFRPDNMRDNESMHGFMDYDGMEFPLPPGSVLRRTDIGEGVESNTDFVGTAKDPAGFSPANGLAGRPAEREQSIQSMSGSSGNNMFGSFRQGMSNNNMFERSQDSASGIQNNMMGGFPNNVGNNNPAHGTFRCGSVLRLSDMMCMYRGKNVEIEFLFGADTYVKKSGILSGAGVNFIVLIDSVTGQETVCDLTDMKFLNFSAGSDSE